MIYTIVLALKKIKIYVYIFPNVAPKAIQLNMLGEKNVQTTKQQEPYLLLFGVKSQQESLQKEEK